MTDTDRRYLRNFTVRLTQQRAEIATVGLAEARERCDIEGAAYWRGLLDARLEELAAIERDIREASEP